MPALWVAAIVVLPAAACLAGWEWGRWHPAERCLEELFEARIDDAYEDGYDDGLADGRARGYGAAVYELREEGGERGASGSPAPLPAPAFPAGAAGADGNRAGPGCEGRDQPAAGAWLGQYAQLAPEAERPGERTDQWHAIWAAKTGAEKELALLEDARRHQEERWAALVEETRQMCSLVL